MSESTQAATTDGEQSETNAEPPVDLTGFQRDLLVAIERLTEDGEGPHGLAVKAKLEEKGYGDVHHGRMYPNLNELVREGLVHKSEKDLRTNEYALSSRGRAVMADYVHWVSLR